MKYCFGGNNCLYSLHLQAQAARNNIYIKDYTGLFDGSYFFSKYDPTEHLNESGRKRFSILLAQDIEGIISTI
jgi:hypothetical protein